MLPWAVVARRGQQAADRLLLAFAESGLHSLLQSQERVVANKEAISLDGGLSARFTHEVLAQACDVAIRVDFLHLPDSFEPAAGSAHQIDDAGAEDSEVELLSTRL